MPSDIEPHHACSHDHAKSAKLQIWKALHKIRKTIKRIDLTEDTPITTTTCPYFTPLVHLL